MGARQGGWSALLSIAGVVLLCLLVVAPGSGAPPPTGPTPTPMPSPGVPVRVYDPPAPRDLVPPLGAQAVPIVDPDGYPRIAKLWGGYDPAVGLDFYAQYDLLISNAFTRDQLLYLRQENPGMKVLYSGIGTYDEDTGPLGSQWIGAVEGMPEYECFYRGTVGQVLRVGFWGHGMFNMTDEWCTGAIADYLVSQYDATVRDGVFFDRVTQAITPYVIDGIDLNHDGIVDDREAVNEAHWRGTERFLDEVRQRLGQDVLIVANDAPLFYADRLHGREYESFVRAVLDDGTDWSSFHYNYEQWTTSSRDPGHTMVMGNPPSWLEAKYGRHPYYNMGSAVVDEAGAYYQRMRFGLTTALLEDGLYSFEFGTTWHGNAWWYDEFDGAGMGKGYLGAPLGEAYHVDGPLTTPNLVQNGDFEAFGTSPWGLIREGALASLGASSTSAPFPSVQSGRIVVHASDGMDAVRLVQDGLNLVAGHPYVLSFWGKASEQLWNVHATVHLSGQPGMPIGLDKLQEMGTAWQHYWIPFTAAMTTSDAMLSLAVGQYVGTVWLDEVAVQEGVLRDVFRRDFEWGTVLCNATASSQTVDLGGRYARLSGQQAPKVKIIVDDDDVSSGFATVGGWARHDAGYDEWGDTYHHALTTLNPDGFISSATYRPLIPYADQYTVYAWLAPHAECDAPVTYRVEHAGGTTSVLVDPRVTEPTWVRLGTYPFVTGMGNAVTLINLSSATWVVADAVKFESVSRYNDGALVWSVTLSGMDGMILLRDPHIAGLPNKVFVPLVCRH